MTYFDAPGRAFATRVALRVANVPFEDERLDFKQLAAARGPAGFNERVPLGQLPTLTLSDGTVHVQGASIARWAGKKAGLYPKDDDSALVVDEVGETLNELWSKLPDDKDAAAKKAKRAEFVSAVVPRYLEHVSRLMAQRGGDGPFVLGKSLSLADLAVFGLVNRVKTGQVDFVDMSIFDKHPRLVKCFEATSKHAVVAAEAAVKKP